MKYGSVIFDLDGTLLESTADHIDWIYNCCREALEKQGSKQELSRNKMDRLLGMDGYNEYISACEEIGVEPETNWKIVTDLRHKRKLEMMEKENLNLYPEAKQTIENLHDNGVKLGVLSNSPDKTVKEVVKFFDLEKYLHFYRGTTDHRDLKHRKPSPKNLKIAMAKLETDPFLHVGNEKTDLEAAQKAGIDSVLVERDKEQSEHDFTVEALSELISVMKSTR